MAGYLGMMWVKCIAEWNHSRVLRTRVNVGVNVRLRILLILANLANIRKAHCENSGLSLKISTPLPSNPLGGLSNWFGECGAPYLGVLYVFTRATVSANIGKFRKRPPKLHIMLILYIN